MEIYTMGSHFKRVKGVAMKKRDVIWTNPNPSQSFAAKAIDVPNILSYDEILIEFTESGNNKPAESALYPASSNLQTRLVSYAVDEGSTYTVNLRYFDFASIFAGNEIISFHDNYTYNPYSNAASTSKDNYCNIPIKVIGIKY